VVSFTSRLLYPGGKSTASRWIGGWVGPRVRLDTVARDYEDEMNGNLRKYHL